jgi:hypothetical protein
MVKGKGKHMAQLKIPATKDKVHPDLEELLEDFEDASEKHAKAKTNRDHLYDEVVTKMQSKGLKKYTTSDGKTTVTLERHERLTVTKAKTPKKPKSDEAEA